MNKKQMIIANILICIWFIIYFAIYDLRENNDEVNLLKNETISVQYISDKYNELNKCSSVVSNESLTVNCENEYVFYIENHHLKSDQIDQSGLDVFKDLVNVIIEYQTNNLNLYSETIDKIFNLKYQTEEIFIEYYNNKYDVSIYLIEEITLNSDTKTYDFEEKININDNEFIILNENIEFNNIDIEYSENLNKLNIYFDIYMNYDYLTGLINLHNDDNIIYTQEFNVSLINNKGYLSTAISLNNIEYEDIKYISFNITDMN